jgi:NDP-sugar pyrophosphorylase family protein
MCSTSDGFKLCTCSGDIDEDKPHWVLERLKTKKNGSKFMVIGTFDVNYLENLEYVLEQLNNHNPFDFEYKPINRDLLTLKFEDGEFNLFYYNKRWTDFDEYEDLEENQKEEVQKGLLKGGLVKPNLFRRMLD